MSYHADSGSQSDAEILAALDARRLRAQGPRSPEAVAEADEEGRARAAAGAPASDWAAHYGFGAEDEIYGKGM